MVKIWRMGKSIDKYDYQTMLCQSRDGVFSAWFDLKEALEKSEVFKVFVLINKYFPNYYFKSDDFISVKKKWEEYLLVDFKYSPNTFNNIYLTTNVYIQKNDNALVSIEPEDDALEIIYGSDDGKPFFAVQFYPYVYFDKNQVYLKKINKIDSKMKFVDQTIAAKKNRLILSEFLKELEQVLNAKISYFEGGHKYSNEFIHKYGIKEDAVLNFGQEE